MNAPYCQHAVVKKKCLVLDHADLQGTRYDYTDFYETRQIGVMLQHEPLPIRLQDT